jgi:hypothetical protein
MLELVAEHLRIMNLQIGPLIKDSEWGHMLVGDFGEIITEPYPGSDDPPTLFNHII